MSWPNEGIGFGAFLQGNSANIGSNESVYNVLIYSLERYSLSKYNKGIDKSYNLAYKYEDSNRPTAPTQIGHDYYTYDSKGCPMLELNSATKGPARCP